jgi:hypothetical protein
MRSQIHPQSVFLVLLDSQILVHAGSCQSLIALATTYFNTHSLPLSSLTDLAPVPIFYIPPSFQPQQNLSLKRRN